MGPEAHGDQEGRLEGAASDSNRSARSERMQGTTCTRSKPVHGAGTRPDRGPGGRDTKAGRTVRGGAKRRRRRAAAAGRWYPRVSLGDGGAPRVEPRRGEKCTGKTACCFSARKRRLGRVSRPIYGRACTTVHGQTQTQAQVVLVLSESGCTRTRPVSRVGPVRVGSDRDGRERPAADGRAGPFRPERTPFFPSHSSLRDSFHYGKNDIGSLG